MKIYLYSKKGDVRDISTQPIFLSEFNAKITEDCNALKPMLIINDTRIQGFLNTNYMYIPTFKRYYYIELTISKNGIVHINGSVDVIYTYAEQIRALSCLVKRQEYKYNDMLVDDKIIARVGSQTSKKRVGTIGNTISYILTVTGGGE